jgi:cellulose synthase (UDP-forming)
MQPCRDAWNAAFYCGSAAVLRRAALVAIGGFEALIDIEDQVTSVKLLAYGWKTLFLNEQLSVGLAAESNSALHDQRNRWCRGSLQILYIKYGPFGRGLNLVQRMFFLQSYWVLGSLGPLAMTISPMVLWLFDWRVFPVDEASEVLMMPLLLLAVISIAMSWLSEGFWLPVLWQAFQVFLAVELLPTALTSLIKPFGKSLIGITPVTAKGSLARIRRVDIRTFFVLVVVLALTIGGYAYAVLTERLHVRHPDELLAMTIWTIYTVSVLAIAVMICFELPYRRGEERFQLNEPAALLAASRTYPSTIEDISLGGCRLLLHRPAYFTVGHGFTLGSQALGELPCTMVRAGKANRVALRFDKMDADTRHRLILNLFANPVVQRHPENFPVWPILKGVVQRFLKSA